MKEFLFNKQVLVLAPSFFGYEKEIVLELKNHGAQVDLLLDRPFSSPFLKALTRVWRGSVIHIASTLYKRKLRSLGSKNYDLIFVVNGQTLSSRTLRKWRQQFSDAKFVLYAWDSVKNRKNIISNLKFFDACFTFEPSDAKNFEMNFRPLFFSKGFKKGETCETSIDISFIGTAHTDRYSIIKAISCHIPQSFNCYFYLYLQASWVFYLYKIITPGFRLARKSEFRFQPLPKEQVQRIFDESRIILDIEHPSQQGLTIRTLETLGAQKKLITTNKDILNYDFFREENVFVIDRANPTVPIGFLQSPFSALPENLYDKYSLSGWLREIIYTTYDMPPDSKQSF